MTLGQNDSLLIEFGVNSSLVIWRDKIEYYSPWPDELIDTFTPPKPFWTLGDKLLGIPLATDRAGEDTFYFSAWPLEWYAIRLNGKKILSVEKESP